MKRGKPYMYQWLRAPNSPNGNPQRLFMVFDKFCSLLAVIDEGYKGTPDVCKTLLQLPTVEIPRSEYHATMRLDCVEHS